MKRCGRIEAAATARLMVIARLSGLSIRHAYSIASPICTTSSDERKYEIRDPLFTAYDIHYCYDEDYYIIMILIRSNFQCDANAFTQYKEGSRASDFRCIYDNAFN